MFTFNLKIKCFATAVAAMFFIAPTASAQSDAKTLEVPNPGMLSSLISPDEKDVITDLTLKGRLNGDDILFIREMAGRDINGSNTAGQLAVLDLTETSIVTGGSAYFKQWFDFKTKNDVVGEHMFENTTLKSLKLPATVTTIEQTAFQGSGYLESVEFPSGVTSMGDLAFKDCTALKTITLPNIVKIPGEVFSGCTSLATVNIPATVAAIDYMAFANCSSLAEIHVAATSAPNVGYNVFQGVAVQTCKVFVPQGCVNTYAVANGWTDFGANIVEEGSQKPDPEPDPDPELPEGTLSIDVAQAGTLSTLITAEQKFTVTALKLTGDINSSDVLFIREMAGRDFTDKPTEGKLVSLDLAEANIVEGGDPYLDGYTPFTTEANTVGINMFHNSTLVDVILPNSLLAIKDNAFDGCSHLASITIPETLTTLGNLAFKNCGAITEFNCPKVSAIGDECFSGCGSLRVVRLPETITSIGFMAFANCGSLEELHVLAYTVPQAGWNAFNGVNYDMCKVFVPAGKAAAYMQASEWKNFKNYVESGEAKPTDFYVEVPGTLADLVQDGKFTIKDLTLSGYINGTDVCLIREMAGRDSKGQPTAGSLKRLDLSGVNIVEGGDPYYFSYNEGLNTRNDEIGSYMFSKLNLQTIILPNSVKLIEGGALSECKELCGEIIVPEGVTRVGEYAFSDCPLLESVILPSTLVDGTGSGFYKDALGGNVFYGCHSLKKIDIPENVTKIKDNSFADCFELVEVRIPSTVTLVGSTTFKNCSKLQDIYVKSMEPAKVGYEAFLNVPVKTCNLHVPQGTVSLYGSTEGWMDFVNIVDDVPTSIGSVDSAVSPVVTVGEGTIFVEASDVCEVAVYTISGVKVASVMAAGSISIPVSPGAYIVRVGNDSCKVVLK